jgi:hypothetical protein
MYIYQDHHNSLPFKKYIGKMKDYTLTTPTVEPACDSNTNILICLSHKIRWIHAEVLDLINQSEWFCKTYKETKKRWYNFIKIGVI